MKAKNKSHARNSREIRTCRKCGTSADPSAFVTTGKGLRFWRFGTCKKCHRERSNKAKKSPHRLAKQREYRQRTKDKHREYHRQWRAQKPNYRREQRDRALRYQYGISLDTYERMVAEQKGLCAICSKPPGLGGNIRVLVVDHCHTSGVVRGLICPQCNRGLGCFRDDLEAIKGAVRYLESYALFTRPIEPPPPLQKDVSPIS